MAGHRGGRRLEDTGGREAGASAGQHPEGWSRRFQHQGERLPPDCPSAIRGRHSDDPVFRVASRVRQNQCGDRVMKATLILIQSDAEHAQAKALVEKLMGSKLPEDRARMTAQVRLIEAYE